MANRVAPPPIGTAVELFRNDPDVPHVPGPLGGTYAVLNSSIQHTISLNTRYAKLIILGDFLKCYQEIPAYAGSLLERNVKEALVGHLAFVDTSWLPNTPRTETDLNIEKQPIRIDDSSLRNRVSGRFRVGLHSLKVVVNCTSTANEACGGVFIGNKTIIQPYNFSTGESDADHSTYARLAQQLLRDPDIRFFPMGAAAVFNVARTSRPEDSTKWQKMYPLVSPDTDVALSASTTDGNKLVTALGVLNSLQPIVIMLPSVDWSLDPLAQAANVTIRLDISAEWRVLAETDPMVELSQVVFPSYRGYALGSDDIMRWERDVLVSSHEIELGEESGQTVVEWVPEVRMPVYVFKKAMALPPVARNFFIRQTRIIFGAACKKYETREWLKQVYVRSKAATSGTVAAQSVPPAYEAHEGWTVLNASAEKGNFMVKSMVWAEKHGSTSLKQALSMA